MAMARFISITKISSRRTEATSDGEFFRSGEQVLGLAGEALGPDHTRGRAIDQLQGQPNGIAGALELAIDQIARIELPPKRLR